MRTLRPQAWSDTVEPGTSTEEPVLPAFHRSIFPPLAQPKPTRKPFLKKHPTASAVLMWTSFVVAVLSVPLFLYVSLVFFSGKYATVSSALDLSGVVVRMEEARLQSVHHSGSSGSLDGVEFGGGVRVVSGSNVTLSGQRTVVGGGPLVVSEVEGGSGGRVRIRAVGGVGVEGPLLNVTGDLEVSSVVRARTIASVGGGDAVVFGSGVHIDDLTVRTVGGVGDDGVLFNGSVSVGQQYVLYASNISAPPGHPLLLSSTEDSPILFQGKFDFTGANLTFCELT